MKEIEIMLFGFAAVIVINLVVLLLFKTNKSCPKWGYDATNEKWYKVK